ncbi:MAG: hypothetical protein WCB27_09480 [Thermoguttaceae bacterium]|jgi:PleD family two-component response regulator
MTAVMPHLDQMTPARILVVDSKQSDYDDLLGIAVAHGCEVCFLMTGRAALRQWREVRGGLLIINVELPDLSGFDLVEMSHPFPKGTIVFLVANQYAVEDEVRALRPGGQQLSLSATGGVGALPVPLKPILPVNSPSKRMAEMRRVEKGPVFREAL